MILSSLINNITLVIALSILYSFIIRRWKFESRANQLISGLLFGAVAVVGMMNPLIFSPGLIFDGRSIVISIAGFIGGPVTALIAVLLSAAYRIWLGGPGAVMGVSVIVWSAAIGVAYHFLRNRRPDTVTPLHILGFGILVHVGMLALTMTLPSGMKFDVLAKIALPVLLVYPLGALLVCLVLLDQESRMHAEEALRESEEKHRRLFETMTQGVVYQSADGTIISANPAAERILGLSLDQLKGKSSMDPSWKAIREDGSELPGTDHPAMAALQTGKAVGPFIMGVFQPKKNAYAWLSINAIPLFHPGETRPFQVYATFEDITEKHKAERDYQTLFREMLDGFALHEIICDAQGQPVDYRFLTVNPTFERMTGLKAEHIVGRTVLEIMPGTEPHWIEIYGRVALTGEPAFFENYSKELDKYFEVTAFRPVPNQFACIFVDITERKRAEKALHTASERFFHVISSLYAGIIVVSNEGQVEFVNQSFCDLFDLTDNPTDLHGLTSPELIQKIKDVYENPSYMVARIQEVLSKGQPIRIEEVSIKGNRTYLLDFVPIFIDGKQHGRLWHHQDITERKRMEEDLREVEERFRLAFYTSPDAVNINRLEDGLYIDINEGFTRLTGFTREDVIGRTSLETNIWHNPADRQELIRGLKEQGYYANLEAEFRRKDSSITTALMSARVIVLKGVPHILSITRDISERKRAEADRRRLEEQLLQAQKMEAIGTLAGGIAHDFNNILSGIMGYTELALLRHIPPGNPAKEYLEEVLRSADRARDLVAQIMTFSRQHEQKRIPMEMSPIIKEALKLLRASLPTTIEIRQQIASSMEPVVLADPIQVHQVIMNLCTNAAHAMKDRGGVLDVSLNPVRYSPEALLPHPDLQSGVEYQVLVVRDTGHGMDREVMDRIFDPFFTTKKVGEGTGLGLAVVYGIVKNYDGVITCESEPGAGATFRIFLPAVTGSQTEKSEIKAAIRGGSERILFVDDERSLTQLFKIQLEKLGYHVRTFNDPIEALADFRAKPSDYDLVITDMTMPHMVGIELTEEIMRIRADIPAILCTGTTDGIATDSLHHAGVRELVIKPFPISTLAALVRKVLDER
jgi:two-component system, cell cycle sensor histidine kinase and response regulator CckA